MVNAGALADVLGMFAAIGSSVILMPQLISVFETESIDGISSEMLQLMCVTSSLWCAYYILIDAWHGVVSSSFNLFITATTLIKITEIKVRNAKLFLTQSQ